MKQRIKLFNSGFTVTEVVIAVAIMSMVTAAAFGIFIAARKSWLSTSLAMSASRTANMAMARMVYGIGKQSGLRSAMGVEINRNMTGAFTGTNYPPEAGAPTHYLSSGSSDGSWRLVITNYDNSITWIDYNKSSSNIVFWPVSGSGNESKRALVGNYISTADVIHTNEGLKSGLKITIESVKAHGSYMNTSQVASFITFRNEKR